MLFRSDHAVTAHTRGCMEGRERAQEARNEDKQGVPGKAFGLRGEVLEKIRHANAGVGPGHAVRSATRAPAADAQFPPILAGASRLR